MNLNKVILAGYLTRDIELRYSQAGTAVGSFGIAMNRKWKTEAGEEREEVCFVDVSAFSRQAETLAQYLHRGDPLLLEGRLKLEQWEDKQTHEKRQKLKVILESFTFVGKKDAGSAPSSAPRPAPGYTQPAAGSRAAAPQQATEPGPEDPEQDCPF